MKIIDRAHPELSLEKQCRLLNLNRSGLYYTPVLCPKNNVTLMNEIRDLWEKYPFYGYRRIHASLVRDGWRINHKRVQRLMKIMGLQALYPKPRTSVSNKHHEIYPYLLNGLSLTKPNQVWATDITYLKLGPGFVYLMAIIDLYSRFIISWRLSITLETSFCLEALNEALLIATPEIFNTDQGCQFTSEAWTDLATNYWTD